MIVRLAQDRPAALAWLAGAAAFDCLGTGLGDPADLVDGQALFELVCAGQVVGAFGLGVHDYADGRIVRCGAAAGAPGHDLLAAIVAFTETEARDRIGARLITCETNRRGMVRKLQRQGFTVAGFILSKAM